MVHSGPTNEQETGCESEPHTMTVRAETIFRELSVFEIVPGGTLADAIAFYRSEKTVKEAKNDLAELALNIADAADGEPTSAQVPGGPSCHPGAFWEASSPTTGVSLAVCSICKQPAKT